jgi:hypothetical protein
MTLRAFVHTPLAIPGHALHPYLPTSRRNVNQATQFHWKEA